MFMLHDFVQFKILVFVNRFQQGRTIKFGENTLIFIVIPVVKKEDIISICKGSVMRLIRQKSIRINNQLSCNLWFKAKTPSV